jgi:hypothetical protein
MAYSSKWLLHAINMPNHNSKTRLVYRATILNILQLHFVEKNTQMDNIFVLF